MSRPATHADAAKRGATVPDQERVVGLREYLTALRHESHPGLVATFDTRIRQRALPGSAARAARRQLARSGYRTTVPPESFFVADIAGPLLSGEIERARLWGSKLATETSPR